MKQVTYLSLYEEALKYWEWSNNHPFPKMDRKVAREGAGSELRSPLFHYGTVMPVYLSIIRYLRSIRPKKNARLIELGCGTGRVLSYLKTEFPSLDVWGTDYSSNCIDYAKRTYGKYGVHYKHTFAQRTSFDTSSFDFVISSHVIEHVSKSEGLLFIRKVKRLLKENCYAFVGTPDRRKSQNLYATNPGDKREYRLIPAHEHEYTLRELRSLAETVFGSSRVRVDKLNNKVFFDIYCSSINRIRPKPGFIASIPNVLYRASRDWLPKSFFDFVTKAGAQVNMRIGRVNYKDILFASEIVPESKRKIPDNLLLVCRK